MIVIFGESKEGEFNKLIPIHTLPELAFKLGEPTETGIGVHMAIQAMLSNQPLLFYKVEEEGFNEEQYLRGFKLLQLASPSISAIALPGVGTTNIITTAQSLSLQYKSLLILSEKDLYDFMTQI